MTGRVPHILILMGSAGGGHRSVGTAIMEALKITYGDQVTSSMVDVFEYAPAPFNKTPEAYQQMIKTPAVWKQFYGLGDGPRRTKFITAGFSLIGRNQAKKLLDENPADVVVSVYHFANTPIIDVLKKRKSSVPFITVVTDLVTMTPAWFDGRDDLVIVPTESAKQLALDNKVDAKKIKIVGLPIARAFSEPAAAKSDLRAKLGWPKDKPIILAMAGGEGVGPIFEIASAIEAAKLDVAVTVVTGKNQKLLAKFAAKKWQLPLFSYGFVPQADVRNFMQASDIYVTKAGPTSITEAFAVGLPMIIYGRLPGQEEGNVAYVTDEGAGVWAPTPKEVVTAIKRWVSYPHQLKAAADTSLTLANPNAAADVARELGKFIKL